MRISSLEPILLLFFIILNTYFLSTSHGDASSVAFAILLFSVVGYPLLLTLGLILYSLFKGVNSFVKTKTKHDIIENTSSSFLKLFNLNNFKKIVFILIIWFILVIVTNFFG